MRRFFFPFGLHLLVMAFLFSPMSPMNKAHCSTGPQLFKAGTKAFRKGKYYKATQLLSKAAKKLPHWGFIRLELARAMQFNGDSSAKIAKHVNQATKLIPKNPRVHLFAGLFWEGQGQAKRALRHYAQAIKLGHYSSAPCLRASRMWLANKQAQPALSCLKKLLKGRKKTQEMHLLLAQSFQQTGQIVKAGTHWMRALSYQQNSLTLLQKVYLYYKQHTPKDPPALRREWKRIRNKLQRRLRRLMPKKVRRRLRPLLPSKR